MLRSDGVQLSNNKPLGLLVFFGSALGIVVYFYLVFLSRWAFITLSISAFFLVSFLLFILAWVGYTLAKSPLPDSIEDILTENNENDV
jgi:predicted DNA-binding transcriptional regulator